MNLFNLFRHPKQLKDLTPAEVAALSHATKGPAIFDVRTKREYISGHVMGAKSYPLGNEQKIISSVDKNQKVVLICKTGHRSQAAAIELLKAGFTDVSHLKGGMDAWSREGRPTRTELE